VTREAENFLDKEINNIDAMTRQVIMSYFRCLQPEMKEVRKKNLPPIELDDFKGLFDDVINSLPSAISKQLLLLSKRAKILFDSYR